MNIRTIGIYLALSLLNSSAFASSLKIATWNVEFLTAKSNTSCAPRSDEDYIKLSEVASSIDADIYALQEVESAKALERIFDPAVYNFIVSERTGKTYDCRHNKKYKTTQQRVAYAVKKSVKYQYSKTDNLTELDLEGNNALRYGLVLQLPKATLVNVHLKSACHSGDVLSNGSNCDVKKRQFDVLTKWVNKQPSSKELVILGDFNHKFNDDDYFLNGDAEKRSMTANTSSLNSCRPRYSSDQGVDHIVTSFDELEVSIVNYVDVNNDQVEDSEESMLSDHCPIVATVDL
ncbi:endonuclease/exonuclease/phosphatase family protein [Photobacterium sp. OFAV2-7]|uniref:endonuclease/exonuclease/phosphatase family protein n=1 Tax=Photobacterium sp. OFAV2-7 TaxID=2917748 RepID=UPI001EF5160E|nr:endonuclease/exonuclease/phosphatase family protein [Photobacterium sp. OFAV2-7]MCG7584427.1 endonuclease/exonuclease/phosphatase family protein [Photobacterium sp. OFAV2-7]